MGKGFALQWLAGKSRFLVAAVILAGFLPHALMMSGIRGFTIGLTFFVLNLFLSALGLATGKYRVFWLCWLVVSIAGFILAGMTTPVGMLLVLPWLAPYPH